MIKEAGIEDAEVLATIISKSFNDVAKQFSLRPENCPRHPSNCTPSWIEADFKRGVRYFILLKDNKPAGCAGLETPNPEICYLERLSVLPEKRGNHFGADLVRHMINCAESSGIRKMGIGIIDKHTELKEWYKSLGFIELGTKSFPHLPFTVCFMELEIL